MNPMELLKMLPCMSMGAGADGKGNPLEGIMKMMPCMPGAMGATGDGENPIANVLKMVQGYCNFIPTIMSMLQSFGGLGNLGGMFGSPVPAPEKEEENDGIVDITEDIAELLKDIKDYQKEVREIVNIAKNTRAKKAQTGGA